MFWSAGVKLPSFRRSDGGKWQRFIILPFAKGSSGPAGGAGGGRGGVSDSSNSRRGASQKPQSCNLLLDKYFPLSAFHSQPGAPAPAAGRRCSGEAAHQMSHWEGWALWRCRVKEGGGGGQEETVMTFTCGCRYISMKSNRWKTAEEEK